jgi:DNA polymerase elongation subunit (family B)
MQSKKPTKMSVNKTFRLIDFKTFDESLSAIKSGTTSGSDSASDSDGSSSSTKRQFMVQMFGVNEQGQTCSMIVHDYKPFFFLHVGDKWDQSIVNAFMRQLYAKSGVKWLESQVDSAHLVDYHKLYGFSAGKKDRFIRITFHNQAAFNRMKNMWYSKNAAGNRQLTTISFSNTEVSIYESNIPPLLRYFHIKNISPSGWVSVQYNKAYKPSTQTTTCTFECICPSIYITPLPEKETRVPYKIMSFDIEASSSHGDFPLPQKTYKKLAQHLVDAYLRADIDSPEETTDLIRNVVMTGFGYGKFDDVDIVYPKREVTRARIANMIEALLNTPLQNMNKVKTDDEEDKTALLTIGAMFDKMRETDKYAARGEEDSDNESEAQEEVEEYHDSDEECDNYLVYESTIKVAKNLTIVDLLLSDKYNRDAKIIRVDEALTQLFPPLKGDEVTFIGSTFMRYGEPEPYLNHCFVVGSCDPVEGATIETTATERELLIRWADFVSTENPDIIIGYNIFGFDYEFMFRRAIENECTKTFLLLSRRLSEVCANEKYNRLQPEKPLIDIEHTTVALASGDYDLKYIKMTGRFQVDMYMYLRREYNFGSYKLDDMASYFISDDIKRVEVVHDTDGNVATHLYSKNLMGLHVGDFIHVEITSFTSDYYDGGRKFIVEDILRNRPADPSVVDGPKTNIIVIRGDHGGLTAHKNIKWGMAKDDVTPQDIFRLTKGDASDRARVAKYCIQDCNLVHHLMSKVDVLTGYVEMSSICSVPISFLVFRGQGIKLTSYVAKKCRDKNTLMPDLEKSGGNEGYEGAIVLPPKCSMYMDNPVACVDYASLYPSSMISQNFSHDSKVWTKEYDLEGRLLKQTGEIDRNTGKYRYDELPGYEYIDIEFDTFRYVRKTPTSAAVKTKCGKKVCRWAQFPENRKGIMPSILEELLKARSDTRKKAKTEPDPFMQNVLDKRQLGYKVTANSLYGQCGAKTSSFYEKDVAASTTATGRMMITYARRIIEEVYGNREYDTECHGPVLTKAEYVYGDTDSVFFTFNLEDPKTGEKVRGAKALEITIEIAQDAAALCTRFLKPPMELSYEKTLMPFILLKKKRYVGMLYETDPKKGKLKYMGLSIKRRDSCDYLKDVYGGILNILMKENDIMKSVEFLNRCLEELVAGRVPMDKLTITRALSSYYKNPQTIAHRVLADRIGKRDPGNKPKPGDRIKFVFFNNPAAKLQGDKIELPEYIVSENLKIDYAHYITKQLMKPLQQLYGLGLEQIWDNQKKQLAIRKHKSEVAELRKKFPDQEIFAKKHDDFCSKKVKPLLFDKWLVQLDNQKNNAREITGFFKPMKK